MPLEDILLRFRRVWAPPGPVMGQAGVPTDLMARVDDELRELTVLLAAIDEEGDAIVRAAEAESASLVARARADADSAIEAARRRAPEVRATGASARFEDRQRAMNSLLAGAKNDAADLTGRAVTRMDDVVSQVVESMFAHLSQEEDHARIVGGG